MAYFLTRLPVHADRLPHTFAWLDPDALDKSGRIAGVFIGSLEWAELVDLLGLPAVQVDGTPDFQAVLAAIKAMKR